MPLLTFPWPQILSADGSTYPGAKLFFYETGTSTLATTYTDAALTTPHTNPVVADATGVFPPIYLANKRYKVVLKTAGDVTLFSADPVSGDSSPLVSTIADMTAIEVPTNGTSVTVTDVLRGGVFVFDTDETSVGDGGTTFSADDGTAGSWVRQYSGAVDVKWFGADPTGATDSTAAFNAATYSAYEGTGLFDLNFPQAVYVSPGQYRITGSVYVHKGQHLFGAGEGASRILLDTASAYGDAIFKLGYNTTGEDAGGLPPEISGLWTYGGPAAHGIVYTGVSGATIHDLFMTAPGIGLDVFGTDTRVTNVQIDGGLTGMKVGGHTHVFSNILIFNPNFGVITKIGTGTVCAEIVFDNVHINYPEYVGVQLTTGVDHRNLSFTNCNFVLNEQFATFTGFVLTQCTDAKSIAFNDCQFNNMYGFAYRHQTGIDNEIYFNDCMFSGTKTIDVYAQSTTARVASIASNRVWFNDCEFVGLHDEPLYLNGTTAETRVFVQGGAFRSSTATALAEIGAGVPTNGASFTCFGMDFDRMNVPVVLESAMTEAWRIGSDRAVPMTGQGATLSDIMPFGHQSVYIVDTTTSASTIRLPRSDSAFPPKAGDELIFIDAKQTWHTNAVTFERGDNTINGAASDYVARQKGGRVHFIFEAGGWRVPGGASALVPSAASSFRVGQFTVSNTGTGTYSISPTPAFAQATVSNAATGSVSIDGATIKTFVSGSAADTDFYLSAS